MPSIPEVRNRPGGWEFIWGEKEDVPVRIRLERLREHSDSITAEFWAEQGKDWEHILGGLRINLVSASARATVSKALKELKQDLDWGKMVEQVCVSALQRFRRAEALLRIGDMPITPIQYILDPVLPQNMITLLFGYGGSTKSTIALFWGALVQSGAQILGLKPVQSPVLILDWETDENIINTTQKSIFAGNDLPGSPDFFYRRLRRPLLERFEDIQADVQREKIGLVIVDSLGKACGGERELKENSLPTMAALGELATTVLLINHRPRSEEGRGKGSYGSVYVENDVRQAFRVEIETQTEPNEADVSLFHFKHNLTPALPPFSYKITWDEFWGIKFQKQDIANLPDVRIHLHAVSQIEIALRVNAQMTFSQLLEETGLKEPALRQTLRRYKGKKFVELGGSPPLWGLVTNASLPEL